MKANYVKPSLKIKEIDTAESMLDGSGENNFTPANKNSFVSKIGTSANTTTEVESSNALSKQGSFPSNQWDEGE